MSVRRDKHVTVLVLKPLSSMMTLTLSLFGAGGGGGATVGKARSGNEVGVAEPKRLGGGGEVVSVVVKTQVCHICR
jgi:hypothetical protein